MSEAEAIARLRRGHEAAALRQRELQRAEGPRPERAVAEALAALAALEAMGEWPRPRDPANERAVERVRARWLRIERNAIAAGAGAADASAAGSPATRTERRARPKRRE